MQAGSAWYANINLPHSVQNKGKNDRIHLVIDCLRNDWSDKLFASMGYDFDYEKKEKTVYHFPANKLNRLPSSGVAEMSFIFSADGNINIITFNKSAYPRHFVF